MTTILDGEILSQEILNTLAETIGKSGKKLTLAVVLVGDNSISKSYIAKKREAAVKVGIGFELFHFPLDVGEQFFKQKLQGIIDQKNISGVVVQLPLPKHWNTQEILNLVPAKKDADVLSLESFNAFSSNPSDVLPPVVGAVARFFEKYQIPLTGKKILVIGRGRLVGQPLSAWLRYHGADFTMIGKETTDITPFTKEADIILSGVGSPSLIKSDMIKEGVVLVDIGTSSEDGKVKGDVDPSVYHLASYVAPVPGGVGPMTVALLLHNLVQLNIS